MSVSEVFFGSFIGTSQLRKRYRNSREDRVSCKLAKLTVAVHSSALSLAVDPFDQFSAEGGA